MLFFIQENISSDLASLLRQPHQDLAVKEIKYEEKVKKMPVEVKMEEAYTEADLEDASGQPEALDSLDGAEVVDPKSEVCGKNRTIAAIYFYGFEVAKHQCATSNITSLFISLLHYVHSSELGIWGLLYCSVL